MIKKTLIILLLFLTVRINSAQNEIEISACSIAEVSQSEFILSYRIKNSFDTGSYSSLNVIIPFEECIVQGYISNGIIMEKDLLFSQINIDLNKNGTITDSYKAIISNKTVIIDNKKLNPITKQTPNYNVLIPYNNSKNYNTNRISPNGKSFTLKNFSTLPAEITIGFNKNSEIEFKSYGNSLLQLEVITPDKHDIKNLLIDGETPFEGITNESVITNGENSNRYVVIKKVNLNGNNANGEIKIGKISKPFAVRVTYYFSISENLILMNQKILRIN